MQERLEFNEGDVGLAGGIQAGSMGPPPWIRGGRLLSESDAGQPKRFVT